MAMSTILGSVVIHQTRSGDQLSFRFETDKALWQGYNDETGSVSPDWTVAGNQPSMIPKAYSARIGSDVALVGEGVWTYNGTILIFDLGTGISVNANNAFKQDFATGKLTIIKNLASGTNMNGDVLSYTASFDNGYGEKAGGQIEIVIDKVGRTPYSGIVNLTTNTLNETNGVTSLTATALLLRGSTTLSSGFTVKWYKMNGTYIASGTTLNITRAMVSGKEMFYAEFLVDNVLQSVYYFSVYDMSDPAQIVFELYSTNDATDSGKDVVYKVKLVKNGDGSLITTATYTALWYNSRRRLFTPAASTLTTAGGVGTLTVKWTDGNIIDAADGLKHGSITVSITANY